MKRRPPCPRVAACTKPYLLCFPLEEPPPGSPRAPLEVLFGGGAGLSAPSLVKPRDTRRLQVSNAYENHEVGFNRGVAPGGVKLPNRELPSIVGNCDLCVRPPGCHACSSRGQIHLGGRIFSNCRAFQSRRAHCDFWADLSPAGLALPRSVSSLLNCVEVATDTLYSIDNKSDARSGREIGFEVLIS
jgi:hypothetical protein